MAQKGYTYPYISYLKKSEMREASVATKATSKTGKILKFILRICICVSVAVQ